MKITNDGTILFYLIRHLKEVAEKMNIDNFSAWYVSKMIIPYCSQEGYKFQFDFYKSIGFKKEPTIDKIHERLINVKILN